MELFDRSLLAAYETLGLAPQPSAWVDLYREAVTREVDGDEPTPRVLAEVVADVLPEVSSQMPPHVGELVNNLAVEQVRYLAVRSRTVDANQNSDLGLIERVRCARERRAERRRRDMERARDIEQRDFGRVQQMERSQPDGYRLLDLVWRLAEEGHAAMSAGDLARQLGMDRAEAERHIARLSKRGWLNSSWLGTIRAAKRRPRP